MPSKIKLYWKWLAGALVAAFALIDYLSKWGILTKLWEWFVQLAQLGYSHLVESALVVFTVVIILMWQKITRLSGYVAITFKDDFRQNLTKNWDYVGRWQLVGRNELLVTESDMGGITKVGQLWTDYRFEFDALIVNDRIGWIVRAQDLFNYYMIQLTPTLIRPHLRLGGGWILLPERPHSLTIQNNQWIHIVTEVRGSEVRVQIDEREAYFSSDIFSMKFFQITQQPGGNVVTLVSNPQPNTTIVPSFTTGRVGFRMWGTEEGRIRKCRVRRI
jgi:hypothetical protein